MGTLNLKEPVASVVVPIFVPFATMETPVKNKTKSKLKYSTPTYLKWYEDMLLMRKFEERAGQLYGMQKIKGFCHLYIGQEAVVAGAMSVIREDDSMITAS